MYNYVMYTSRIVPQWLSGWGLFGAVSVLGAYLYAGFDEEFGFTTVNVVLSVPIDLQEMALAVWLMAKGFNSSALRSIAPSTASSRSSASSITP